MCTRVTEPTEVYAGSGDGRDLDRLEIILPIVGGVVLVAIIGIALLIFFYWRRKKKRKFSTHALRSH